MAKVKPARWWRVAAGVRWLLASNEIPVLMF